jgi:tetratricopeptide (TPR) repeat protein
MDKPFQYALILLEQRRYDLAEEKLRQALATDPANGLAHALLAQCLCERNQLTEATDEAYHAVRTEPNLAAGHAALARALHERNYFHEAKDAIEEALRLEPRNPDNFARLAAIDYSLRDWAAALDAAEQGLKLDPEDIGCNNLRAMALVKLGRKEEAGKTLATTLARDPENAYSHANQGWALLHEGKYQKALEHFREALRLEPGLDYARVGIVEAMKARTGVYALLLRYFLWMGRWSRKVQWLIILGLFFGNQALGAVANSNPALKPWIQPIQIAYVVFAIATWLAVPLFNLLLRLNGFGRYALSRDQTVASNWIGGLLLAAVVCLGVWLVSDEILALVGALYFGLLLLPVSGVFVCPRGWPRRVMAGYALVLALLVPAHFALLMLDQVEQAFLAFQAFIWGCFLSGLAANILAMQIPRR